MEWYICFCLSLAVFISAIILSVSLNRFKHKRGRIIDAPKVLFVGIVLSSVLVFFPIYYNEFRGNIGSFIETLMLSLHNTIRLFAIDSDFSIIGDNIGFLDQWFKTSYTILSLILFIAAPLFTFGFVLSFFKNLSSYKKYFYKYNCDVYIFSKLNERSLALAQSLVSNNKKRTIVFTGVNRDNNVNIDELIDNAYVIGAICFKKELNSINFNRFHSKHKEMIFFICGDNDSENIEESLTLISNYRDRNNTSLYVFSNSIECELIINNTDVGCLKVRRIDEIRSLIYRTLYDRGFEIFNSAYKTEDNSKKITAVIIGMGRYGTEMLKALSWFCQMDGYIAEINVFDKAENAESVFESLCPELMDEKHNGNFGVEGEAKYKIQFYPGMDIKSSDFDNCIFSLRNVTYVFVSLGDDELNISASIKLRSIFERIGVHPRIQAVVYSSKKKKTLDGISNFKNQKYDIEFIGDLETSYSEDVILGSDVEEAALERHKKWGAEEDFWLYEYNYRSSVASAIHKKMKIECGIPGAGKDVSDRTEEEKHSIRMLEHCRWNAYMRSEGYCYSPVRNDLAKTHTDLVPFGSLSLEKQKIDDD